MENGRAVFGARRVSFSKCLEYKTNMPLDLKNATVNSDEEISKVRKQLLK